MLSVFKLVTINILMLINIISFNNTDTDNKEENVECFSNKDSSMAGLFNWKNYCISGRLENEFLTQLITILQEHKNGSQDDIFLNYSTLSLSKQLLSYYNYNVSLTRTPPS